MTPHHLALLAGWWMQFEPHPGLASLQSAYADMKRFVQQQLDMTHLSYTTTVISRALFVSYLQSVGCTLFVRSRTQYLALPKEKQQ